MRNPFTSRRAARLALCAVAVAMAVGAHAAPKSTIVLGSTNATSSHYTVSAAMVKAITLKMLSAPVSRMDCTAWKRT